MFWRSLSFFLFLIKVGHESFARQAAGDGCDHLICRWLYKTEWDCDRRGHNKVMFTLKLTHVPPQLVLSSHLDFLFGFTFRLTECFCFFFLWGRWGKDYVLKFYCCCYRIFMVFQFVSFSEHLTYAPCFWIVVLEQCECLSVCLLSHSSERNHVLAKNLHSQSKI